MIAIGATYGSISAVIFITGITYLQTLGVEYGGYMVAEMALMASPAIVVGLVFAALFTKGSDDKDNKKTDWKEIFREAFLNPSVFLLVGALIMYLLCEEDLS